MALGYSFEVHSMMSPIEAKAAIGSKLKNWFAIDDGARGWCVGPVMCLWLGLGYYQGPSVVAWISADNFGTRIRGRAGRGLVQTAAVMAGLTVLVMVFWHMPASGPRKIEWTLPLATMMALLWWSSGWSRRDADPLVQFLRLTLGEETPKPRRKVAGPEGALLSMNLSVDGNEIAKGATPDQVRWGIETIERKGPNGFLILSRDDQHYMQTALEAGGFVLEKREGSSKSHFRAASGSVAAGNFAQRHFTGEDVTQALFDYLKGHPTAGIRWEPL